MLSIYAAIIFAVGGGGCDMLKDGCTASVPPLLSVTSGSIDGLSESTAPYDDGQTTSSRLPFSETPDVTSGGGSDGGV